MTKTERENEMKKIREIVQIIKRIEKNYTQKLVKRACTKYVKIISEKNKAEKDIKELESKLAKAKEMLK